MSQVQVISLTEVKHNPQQIMLNWLKIFSDAQKLAVLPESEYLEMKEMLKAKEFWNDFADAKNNSKSYTNVDDLLHDLAA
ncbi:MAG: hypothetical protein LBU27_04760 [Candidatus Peribacteria bacterium]|nr:hypothetical protein [Candidatus Peribacteria bacterium]